MQCRLLLCLVFILCVPLKAWAYCSVPDDSPPSCTEQMFQKRFADEWAFRSCKGDVEAYLSELEDWVMCVQREAEERSDEAVKQFNCKVEGDDFCL